MLSASIKKVYYSASVKLLGIDLTSDTGIDDIVTGAESLDIALVVKTPVSITVQAS